MKFENDVVLEGTQTVAFAAWVHGVFESDVVLEGTQTLMLLLSIARFESDVVLEGTQTVAARTKSEMAV